MRRYPKGSEIQMGLFQRQPEGPEWTILSIETKQAVKQLLIELLEATLGLNSEEPEGRNDD
jgi:hypothetical protein